MSRTKTCKECGEIKPITAFPKNGFDRKTGLQKYAPRCRRCHNVYQQDLLYKRREKEFEQKQAVMAALMDAEREKEEAAKARRIAQSVVLAKAACPILHIGLWTEPLLIPQGMLQI
ncbi:hypothetical protein [Neisseria bergeri]|uniref:hypothetical protein n=1 Tax=Neisseria bergeri TaxID=1906581 RepID=UPI0027E00CED|nr:hypothetical protein [Neisseria bergeri]